IASAIVTAPRYLVMDDPMMNLDWRGIIKLREIIRRLKSEGKGIVITARRLKGLEPVADKIVWLDGNGRRALRGSQPMELEDPKEENLNDPKIAVSFEKVWFRYSKARDYVLKDITLSLESGRCIALMGPNGSGKTTLAKLVNGLHKPSRGRVRVLGMDTGRFTAAQLARYVAFVFQDPDKHLVGDTVWDEVTFGPRNLGLGFDHAERALEVMGLGDRRDDPPQSLSMGEKIRLSIASALATNPEILILDEPTTGQDEETLEAIAGVVSRLKALGKTVLMITHDSDYALKVSDRVVVIEGGAIAADGDPEEILLNEDLVRDLGLEPPTALMRRAVEVRA
ncbi:MAG: ABC transporter, partial [Thaumarchaeota archaeon]